MHRRFIPIGSGVAWLSATDFRTAEAARDALRRLQNPKLRFEDYFFWLDFKALGPQAVTVLRSSGWPGLSAWMAAQAGTSFSQRRELLVSQTIALKSGSGDATSIYRDWKLLIDDGAFWSDLKAVYRFDGQLAASDDLIASFRAEVSGTLGDLVLDLASGSASSPLVRQGHAANGNSNVYAKRGRVAGVGEGLRTEGVRQWLTQRHT
jgi:hypothetical protein